MPQVTINEIDQSRYLSVANRAPLVALTPVIASFGPTNDGVIVSTENEYDNTFGPQLRAPVLSDISRNYAITLINSGVTLLAKRIVPIVITGGSIDSNYNINDITAKTTYTSTDTPNFTANFTAKYFGSRGNDIAVKVSKITLNSGVLNTSDNNVIYNINTYFVNQHNVTAPTADGLYIGTFDDNLQDYVGVDNFTLSVEPTDDNYVGNTTYLNSQLKNIDISITLGSDVATTKENYIAVLEKLCSLTTDTQAIMLVDGADYFTIKSDSEVIAVTNETYTAGTNVVNTPIKFGTFSATVTATVSEEEVTYNITEGATEGTLVCDDISGFTGTLNYKTGVITLTGLPEDAVVKMNYSYYPSFTNEEIRKQFTDTISYVSTSTSYPKTHNAFWENFADHYVYDFDVIVSSGFTGLNDVYTQLASQIHTNMLRLAVSRGDAVALLDTPQTWNYENVYNYTEYIGGWQSIYSFGAVHAPWCKMRDLSTGNYAMMPASLAFLGAIASGLVSNGESSLWYAPAGVSRASCNNVFGAQYEIGGTILNYWQNDNIARVNPIMKVLAYGYCVYGNATLMQNKKGYTKSSLQSLGTRFLCNAIKKAIFSLCVRLTFEPNDYNLWSTFRTELGDILRQYQLNGVISQYEIVMDDTTVTDEDKQNLTVPGKVNIVPTLPAEYFDIDFTISAQGVTFAEQVIEEE